MTDQNKTLQTSMFALLGVYAIALIIATFVENTHGVALAKDWFYHSLWFIILQLLLVANFLLLAFKVKVFSKKQVGDVIFHFAFVIILVGAFVTHYFSYEGLMHIREGESSDYIHVGADMRQKKVPFKIQLNKFVLDKYPGSSSPSSYASDITLIREDKSEKVTISMNKFIDVGGFRIFQSSYDKDEKGTVLSVNYDRTGMIISYTGYFLLIVGMILSFFNKASRIRVLISRLSKMEKSKKLTALLFFALSLSFTNLHAQRNQSIVSLPSVSKIQAESFGKLPVQNPRGRIEPVNSWSEKILQKLYKKTTFQDYSAEQVFLNLFLYPYEWGQVKLIVVSNEQIMMKLNREGKHISFYDVFNKDREFILETDINEAYRKQTSERTRYDNDLIKLDEAVNIVFQIQQGKLLALFPDEKSDTGHWYSTGDDLSVFQGKDSLFVSRVFRWYAQELIENNNEQASEVLEMIKVFQDSKSTSGMLDEDRIEAELWYNKANIFGHSFKLYLLLGFVLLGAFCYSLFTSKKSLKGVIIGIAILLFLVFLWHTFGLGLRWYIAGYAPWTNSYESMVFLAWAIMLTSLLFVYRYPVVLALGALTAGLLLCVATMSQMNPEITPLVPVLQSFWLMVHVAVIMIGYSYFLICAMIGLFNMTIMVIGNQKNERIGQALEELTIVNEIFMILGLFFMTIGTFLGAVWANETWGRYWGWDPKETWALISIIVYTIVFHIRLITKKENMYLFNLLSILAIASIMMTYFGVNYYFGGMHSYGKTSGEIIPIPFILGLLVIVVLSVLAHKKNRSNNEN